MMRTKSFREESPDEPCYLEVQCLLLIKMFKAGVTITVGESKEENESFSRGVSRGAMFHGSV